jgi:hypothetical protein
VWRESAWSVTVADVLATNQAIGYANAPLGITGFAGGGGIYNHGILTVTHSKFTKYSI